MKMPAPTILPSEGLKWTPGDEERTHEVRGPGVWGEVVRTVARGRFHWKVIMQDNRGNKTTGTSSAKSLARAKDEVASFVKFVENLRKESRS